MPKGRVAGDREEREGGGRQGGERGWRETGRREREGYVVETVV